MATATNVSGNAAINFGFTEIITSGVVTTLNLPATMTQTTNYGNGTSAGNVDLIYAKQLTLNAATTVLDLTSLTDLNGGSINFARVREFIVQNLSSTGDVKVYANTSSGVPWLPQGSTSPLFARAYNSTVASTQGGKVVISDPSTVGATTGNYVATSSSKLVLDPGSNSCSVNVLFVGGSAVS